MKRKLLDYLVCPLCQDELTLVVAPDAPEGAEIIEGELRCAPCEQCYPIRRGIPRLLPPSLAIDKQKTAQAFGWQWLHFVEMHAQFKEQFLDWIKPIQPEFFQDKVVLDAGCGIGRHAYFAALFGATDVIGMDLSDAVETAYQTIGHLPNAHVIQADIYNPPFRHTAQGGPFDCIYSIGVLHHLPDPQAGFHSLVRFLQPGGTIFGWVYGYENNGIVHYFIDPLRKNVTTKLPPSLLRGLAWPLAIILQAVVKGIYRPLHGTSLFHFLPSHDYLYSLAAFGFRQNYTIVFDHLVAPTAFYIKRDAFEAWFHHAGLQEIELSWRNQNSWRGRGQWAGPAGQATSGAGALTVHTAKDGNRI